MTVCGHVAGPGVPVREREGPPLLKGEGPPTLEDCGTQVKSSEVIHRTCRCRNNGTAYRLGDWNTKYRCLLTRNRAQGGCPPALVGHLRRERGSREAQPCLFMSIAAGPTGARVDAVDAPAAEVDGGSMIAKAVPPADCADERSVPSGSPQNGALSAPRKPPRMISPVLRHAPTPARASQTCC